MPIHSLSPDTENVSTVQPGEGDGLTLGQYTNWLLEIQNQPPWRAKADKEMDYVDGNQLDSELLQKMADLGIPPAIEPLIGPAIDAVLGFEAKTRTDWRVTPDSDGSGDDVAKALNYKINQAERQSGADRACSDAFKSQVSVGLGWVEVSRETNPFKFGKRCKAVHRNEIFWDWLSKEPDLSDARYLIRRRWADGAQVALKFPEKKDLVRMASGNAAWVDQFHTMPEGGSMPNLFNDAAQERGWSIEEQEWRDVATGRVCLFEVWYRKWEEVIVIRLLDGRVVEYDKANPVHTVAIAAGVAQPQRHVIPRMYCAYWMGPHKLHEGRSPYRHSDFPYVPFWGKREDRTNVPYGAVRGMMYLQDNVNSAIAKIRWGLSAVRTERTKGAVDMTDEKFRQTIARSDADVVLDAAHMAKAGARFEVKRDFQLNEQQYKMLGDSRLGIQRSSGITASFQGQAGTAQSGVQESTQIEQTTQQLADVMDNFRFGRTKVGELLMALEIEDLIGKPNQKVVIRGNALTPDREVMLNVPEIDAELGLKYMDNDVERIRLKVALNDVPSTPSFRSQQLQAMSEAFKAMPPQYQAIALPHLLNLMDVPNKDEIIEAIKKASAQESPEQIQARIDEAVAQALAKAQFELKSRELDLKYSPERMRAEIGKLLSETVVNGVQAAFAAMQAGGQIAAMPQIAPVADAVMQAAGYRAPNPAGDDPNFPTAVVAVPPQQVQQNTSPVLPPVPASAVAGADQGIETADTGDNLTPR